MGLVAGLRGWVVSGVVMAGALGAAWAQTSIQLTEPAAPLLPQSFGEWKAAGSGAAGGGNFSLTTVNRQALEECGPQRSQVAEYVRGGRSLHVEAVQFGDRTGAFSAFTLVERPGMQEARDLGAVDALGDGAVLFAVGNSLVLVNGADAGDMGSLQPLAKGMPKVVGNQGVAPLLPTLPPVDGLVNGSLRYALGPETYAAQGGVLPAHSLGWEKSAEAVTAQYADKRGKETLTLLLYPTPEISGAFTRSIGAQVASGTMGANFANARVRREGLLVALASGAWPADDAQKLVESAHLRQVVSIDKDVQPTFHSEVQKTFSLLFSIAVLSGVLMLSAILLALFLGGGRALVRVMRGKPAATEVEFLSLHLSPQNKPADFTQTDSAGPI